MESKKRSGCLVIVTLIVVVCCGAAAVAAAFAGWATSRAFEGEPLDLGAVHREHVEKVLQVGNASTLDITNFAGSITIRAGQDGQIRTEATKRASTQSKLNEIEVQVTQRGEGVEIRTRGTRTWGNASVDLEISAPADTRLKVDTGAGEVRVQDITAGIDVHSGAGTIDVQGAEGTARLGVGAGQITYTGTPSGDCRFETGVGEITLRISEDAEVEIDVGTALGDATVHFGLDGKTSERRLGARQIEGTVGDGRDGSVYARTGAGSVDVYHQ